MDTIFISELRIDALIGIYAWEREAPQTVELNLEIAVNAARCARSGRISDTVDYAKVVKRIREALADRHFTLIEKLAEELAAIIMTEFGSPWIRVSIAKLAPIPGVRKLGLTIERGKKTRS